jgi:DNA-binding transcriptional MocR family regulator
MSLPSTIDAADALRPALAEKVAFVPGTPFYAADPDRSTIRLNFSNAAPEQIDEGIRRLGRVLDRLMSARARNPSGPMTPVGAC